MAAACVLHLDLSIPTLIDDMSNVVDDAYAASPDRLYLVGAEGRIACKSAPGPMGLKPDELEAGIIQMLKR